MKNACDKYADDLSALIDGELPEARRVEVEAHVAGCEHCRQRVAELKCIVEGVAALPKVQPAPQFLADVRRKIATGEEPREFTWVDFLFRPVWLKVPLEALAALVVLVSFLIHDRPVPYHETERHARLNQQNRLEQLSPAEEPGPAADESPAAPVANEERQPTVVAAAPPPSDSYAPGSPAPAKEEKALVKMTEQPARQTLALGSDSARRDAGAMSGYDGKAKSQLPALKQRLLVISNDAKLHFTAPPTESFVVEADSEEAAKARLEMLAGPLKGQVTRGDAKKLYVSLPAQNVAAFKARLALTKAVMTNMVAESETASFVDAAATQAAVAGESALTAGVASTESNQMIVIEIEVVTPKP